MQFLGRGGHRVTLAEAWADHLAHQKAPGRVAGDDHDPATGLGHRILRGNVNHCIIRNLSFREIELSGLVDGVMTTAGRAGRAHNVLLDVGQGWLQIAGRRI